MWILSTKILVLGGLDELACEFQAISFQFVRRQFDRAADAFASRAAHSE